MTVIAWDGKKLAADKQCTNERMKSVVTKIHKINDHLVFSVNDFDAAIELISWWKEGANPEKWPTFQSDKDWWSPLHVIKPDKTIWRYERRPYPFRIEQQIYAVGGGRDYALAAMHMGADAEEAVKVACHFDCTCGMGIDCLTLE